MPKKLKSSARKSRRNKRIGIVVFVTALVALSAALAFVFYQSSPDNIPVVQGKVLFKISWVDDLNTTRTGNVTVQLRDDKPITSGNFRNLVEQGRYNGTIFHRVIEGFMIQGGHISESIPSIPDEIGNNNHNVNGTIAMANAGPNTATSEFFINVADNSNLYASFDTSYTVFGNVIAGMDVVMEISRVPVDNPTSQSPKPIQDVTLISAEILT